MNLKQLDYFIAVAGCLSFTKAAKKCFISQTAMTQQIKALENTVGVPLFTRDKHHVELTAAGKIYLTEAKMIIDKHDEAIKLAKLVSEGTHGEINIGFVNGFGQSEFTELLRNFRMAYPNIKINLIRNNYAILKEQLEHGECDIIFVLSPLKRKNNIIKHKFIRSYQIMAVVNEMHPLALKEKLTYKDIEKEEFIMMQPPGRNQSHMEESILIYERAGYIPNIIAVEGEQETLLLMVSVGMGISLIPEYITKLYSENKNIKIIPMTREDGMAETLDMEVRWSSENSNPAIEKFLELC